MTKPFSSLALLKACYLKLLKTISIKNLETDEGCFSLESRSALGSGCVKGTIKVKEVENELQLLTKISVDSMAIKECMRIRSR